MCIKDITRYFLRKAVGWTQSAVFVNGPKRVMTGVCTFNNGRVKVNRAGSSTFYAKTFGVCTRRAFAFGSNDFIYTPLSCSFIATLPANRCYNYQHKGQQ